MTVNFRKHRKGNRKMIRLKKWEVKKNLERIGLIWNVKLLKKIANVNVIHDQSTSRATRAVIHLRIGKKLIIKY